MALQKGERLEAAGDLTGAAHEYRAVGEEYPTQPAPFLDLARVAARSKDFNEGIYALDRLSGLSLHDPEKTQAKEARTALQQAIRDQSEQMRADMARHNAAPPQTYTLPPPTPLQNGRGPAPFSPGRPSVPGAYGVPRPPRTPSNGNAFTGANGGNVNGQPPNTGLPNGGYTNVPPPQNNGGAPIGQNPSAGNGAPNNGIPGNGEPNNGIPGGQPPPQGNPPGGGPPGLNPVSPNE